MKNHHLHDIRGERKDQLLITTDKNGHNIGIATREECHAGEGKTHLAFMAFVVRDGKIILAKRSKQKSLWAGYWDASVVSHVLEDETIEEAAYRRGKEELGVEVEFKDLGAFYYFAKHENSSENEYCHVLVGNTKEEVYPNPIEIEEVKLVKFDELVKLAKNTPEVFTPWLKLTLDKLSVDKISEVSS